MRSHETIMQMIGKLGEDEEADWLSHLAEIVHACNATQSAVTGYSPHYLMFGCQLRLPVDLYFPTLRSAEGPRWGTSTRHVNEYITTVRDCLRTALQEAQAQSTTEAWRQKQYYDWTIDTIGFETWQSHPSQGKKPFKGRGRSKDRWEDKPHKVVHQITTDVPLYEVKDQHRHSHILHCNWFLLIASEAGIPLCMGVCQAQDQMYQLHPSQVYSWGEWHWDIATGGQWSGNHPVSG